MPTITIRNIPPQSAAANRRSINSEILACIERAVRGRKLDPEVLLRSARRLRLKTKNHPVTDDELRTAKLMGRP